MPARKKTTPKTTIVRRRRTYTTAPVVKVVSPPKKYVKKQPVKKAVIEQDRTTGLLTQLGSKLGNYIGPMAGSIGGAIGSGLDAGISHFVGHGNYSIVQNSLLHTGNPDMPDIINRKAMREGGVVFRKSEYLGDLISSGTTGAFSLQAFPLNPGQVETFPWFSQISPNYTNYKLEGAYFDFRSMSTDISTSQINIGTVFASVQYNAGDPPFTSKQEVENSFGGTSVRCSKNLRYFVECSKNQNVLDDLYIRPGPVPTGQSIQLYDLGTFYIGSQGVNGSSINLGEIWIVWECVLYKEKLYNALGLANLYGWWTDNGYDNTHPLGTGSGLVSQDGTNIAMTFTGTQMNFPGASVKQTFNVQVMWQGATGATFTLPSISATGGVTTTLIWNSPQAGATSQNFVSLMFLCVIQPNQSVNPAVVFGTGGSLPGGANNVSVYIQQIPNDADF